MTHTIGRDYPNQVGRTSICEELVAARATVTTARSKADQILLALWEIKRQLNEEAHYDIDGLARRANAFDVDLAMKQLRVSLNPFVKAAKSLPDAGTRPVTSVDR